MRKILSSIFKKIRYSAQRVKIKSQGIKQARRLAAEKVCVRLDLGSGSTKRPGFISIDLLPCADLQWDIRWSLPFAEGSVVEIRSDHLLEHFELPGVVKILRECRRVLIPGGILDFSVPCIDAYIEAYIHRDFNFLKEKIYDVPKELEFLYNTCFDRISWLLHRGGEHKSLFDKESIIAKVKLAGFTNVTTREFNPEEDSNYRFSSVYIVATK